jgi:hypothetical protein
MGNLGILFYNMLRSKKFYRINPENFFMLQDKFRNHSPKSWKYGLIDTKYGQNITTLHSKVIKSLFILRGGIKL